MYQTDLRLRLQPNMDNSPFRVAILRLMRGKRALAIFGENPASATSSTPRPWYAERRFFVQRLGTSFVILSQWKLFSEAGAYCTRSVQGTRSVPNKAVLPRSAALNYNRRCPPVFFPRHRKHSRTGKKKSHRKKNVNGCRTTLLVFNHAHRTDKVLELNCLPTYCKNHTIPLHL